MGSGSYSASVHSAARTFRTTHGISDFDYSDSGKAKTSGTHPDLDPRGTTREARDSDDHPQSRPVVFALDVTGSNATVARTVITKLPLLMGLLTRKSYLADPQIATFGIGDATCDRSPLQVSQFESDNRMDEHLGKLHLESGGGGGIQESYELALYYVARHVVTDAWERRGEKGYLVLCGDEQAYKTVDPREVAAVMGDTLQEPISFDDILAEVQQRWEVFFVLGRGASHEGESAILEFWRKRLGQHVIELADLDALCETVGLAIGMTEGSVDLDSGLEDLTEEGADTVAVAAAGSALATIGASSSGGRVSTVAAPEDMGGEPGNTRL